MSLLELTDLSYAYEMEGLPLAALNNLTLKVSKGEMLAIQGPSGSGKSTLLHLMGGLLRVQQGQIQIEGEDLSQLSDAELAYFRNRKLGFVFQQFHLLPQANVLQNIMLPALYPAEAPTPYSKARARATLLAKKLGLSDRLKHFPNQLSGGQQQRVAIARALMNQPTILFADEPTGNLDSKTSSQILELLKELNHEGTTIIIITHDNEVAKHCSRIIYIRDGSIEVDSQSKTTTSTPSVLPLATSRRLPSKINPRLYFQLMKTLLPIAKNNLLRKKGRTALNMLGIIIGIAAVMAMITLGQFTKKKIIESYAELGVNTLLFYGYPNFDLKAKDAISILFRYFDWEKDLLPLKRIFPEILNISPVLQGWNASVSYGGKSIDNDIQISGVSEEALRITNRELIAGTNFTIDHVERKSAVCIVGFEVAQTLFKNTPPLGELLFFSQNGDSAGCRVIGVLKSISSNRDWFKPNLAVYLPYTYFQTTNSNWWATTIKQVLIQVNPKADIEQTGKKLRAFFEMKYGNSGKFRANSDSVLIAQMKKFLNLFTILLASIAMLSLGVGGLGITNMMLVSVGERLREIGLRKAIGATDLSVRIQFLLEAILICVLAGIIGMMIGFGCYELAIWIASKFTQKLQFQWVIDWTAVFISVVSIFIVGILSGLVPAFRAEKLQVVTALRSE